MRKSRKARKRQSAAQQRKLKAARYVPAKAITGLSAALGVAFTLAVLPAHAATPSTGEILIKNSTSPGVPGENNFRYFSPASLTEGVDTGTLYSGNSTVVQPNGSMSNWKATFRMSLSAVQQAVDKGDMRVQVNFDGRSFDNWDNDLLEAAIRSIDPFGTATKLIGYGEDEGSDEFNNVMDWKTINSPWFNLAPGTRDIELYFYSTDGETGDNLTGVRNIQVYLADQLAPKLSKVTVNNAPGTYKAGDTITFNLQFDEPVKVNTALKIPMNSGGQAVYQSGNLTNTLTYTYTVGATDQQSAFNLQGGSALNTASNMLYITDLAGNALSEQTSGFATDFTAKSIAVDGGPPQIAQITASKSNTALKAGDTVDLTVRFGETVNVSGSASSIMLQLNNGASVPALSVGNGLNELNFRYTVAASGQDTAQLAVTGLTGGTITDPAGNALVRTIQGSQLTGLRVDTTAPAVQIAAPPATYGKSVSLNVAVTDANGSGPKSFRYYWSADANPPADWGASGIGEVLTDSLNIPSPTGVTGEYYLHVRGYDSVGNSKDGKVKVFLDNSAPTVTFTPDGSALFAKSHSVTVRAADAQAGLNGTGFQYQWLSGGAAIDESGWRTDGSLGTALASAPTGASATGRWKLAVRLTDQAGNTADAVSLPFEVDRTGPQITVTPDGSISYKKSYAIRAEALDAAGVQSVSYQWSDSGATPDANDSGWLLTAGDGTIGTMPVHEEQSYLHIKAVDAAGNVAYTQKTFRFDLTAPTVAFEPNGSGIPAKSASPAVTILDPGGKNAVTSYYQWKPLNEAVQEADWRPVDSTGFVKTGGDGLWVLHVKATDAEGNSAQAQSEPFLLDNSAPIGSLEAVKPFTNVPAARVRLLTQEPFERRNQLQYQLSTDGGASWSPWSGFVDETDVTLPDLEGRYTILLKLRDYSGNESGVYSTAIVLDKTKPAATVQYSTTGWTKSPVTASLTNLQDPGGSASDKIKIVSSGGSTHTFTANGAFDFVIEDEAGNRETVTAQVGNIYDETVTVRMNPEGSPTPAKSALIEVTVDNSSGEAVDPKLQYQWSRELTPADDQWVSAATTAWDHPADNLHAELELVEADGVSVTKDVYRFMASGGDGSWYLHVKAVDRGDLPTVRTSQAVVLDNTAPQAAVVYSPAPGTPTGNPVVARLQSAENIAITQPASGDNYYVFEQNGSFTFNFRDAAGNAGTAEANVDWIDPALKTVSIAYSTLAPTNGPVTVTISANGDPAKELVQVLFPDSMRPQLIEQSVTQAVYQVEDNGSFSVLWKYAGSAELEAPLQGQVTNIDKEAPSASLTYSRTGWTNQNVSVTANVYDNAGQVTLIEGGSQGFTHLFTENGERTFIFRDQAGNEGRATAAVYGIDKLPPTARIEYSVPANQWTNGEVVATLIMDEQQGQSPQRVINNNGSPTYTFKDNGEFTFVVQDEAGNTQTFKASVANIDRTAPTATVVYDRDPARKTREAVTASIRFGPDQSPIAVTNNAGGLSYTFTENGTFTFEYKDAAGNTDTVTAVVSNIDREGPTAELSYSRVMATNKDVVVTIQPSEPVTILTNSGRKDYTFTQNGTFDFVMVDEAGNQGTVTADVYWIDKQAPTGSLAYSTTAPTSEPVVVTLTADEPIYVTNNQTKPQRVFYQNGSYVFTFMDKVGNTSSVTAVVSNIDSTPPEANVTYSTTGLTNEPVIATVSSNEPFTVVNNGGSTQYRFTDNGVFTFVIRDALGNTTSVDAKVSNIDRTPPRLKPGTTQPLVFKQNGAFSLADVQALDERDGDLTSQISVNLNGFDIARPGTYTVEYSVSDRAGNTAKLQRTVTVVGMNEKQLFINGELVGNQPITVAGAKVKFEFVNAEGELNVMWKKGRLTRGEMKNDAFELAGTELTAPVLGWYTFYIQDQERSTKLVHVYISSLQ
ncbi:immunoglobulin-like domain-containing protein [Paenibacillus chartarius]|uniref:Immunoglobulin-like domain-containing protein n=1 Tax=Paenibacillus chartarius TaxID=747481 RepID=A0ABV6DM45_9BACL